MNNDQKREWLAVQIDRRLTVLREWAKAGVPDGMAAPRSLNAIREWSDASLMIKPIGSPNSYKTNHPIHGRAIEETLKALILLKTRPARESTERRSGMDKDLREKKKALASLEEALRQAGNRYVAMSLDLAETSRALRLKEQGESALLDRLKVLEQENVGLRSLLNTTGPSKVRHVDFGRPRDGG